MVLDDDGEGPAARAALHYGGEVHRSVKSFSLGHGLRQGMVCQRR